MTGLVDGFFGAPGIPFAAEFALRRRRPRALLTCARLRFGGALPFLRKALGGDDFAGATRAFGATLATIALAFEGVSFARPLVFHHPTTWAKWLRNALSRTLFEVRVS